MKRLFPLALLVVSGAAFAEADAGVLDVQLPDSADAGNVVDPAVAALAVEKAEKPTFVVTTLESNASAEEHVLGLTQILGARFTTAGFQTFTQADIQRMISVERQKQLIGSCTDKSCMAELGDALGARYIVGGRVDKYGENYLLSVTLFDGRKTEVKTKSQREVKKVEHLPQAVDEMADELLQPFGVAPKVGVKLADRMSPMGVNLGMKLGTKLFTSLVELAPVIDLELGFRLNWSWEIILQVSAALTFNQTSTVGITPGLLGFRYHFRGEKDLQPTLGLGLGVLSVYQAVAMPTGNPITRLQLPVLAGVQYMVTPHFAVVLDLSIDLIGLGQTIGGVAGAGLNFSFALGVCYRF